MLLEFVDFASFIIEKSCKYACKILMIKEGFEQLVAKRHETGDVKVERFRAQGPFRRVAPDRCAFAAQAGPLRTPRYCRVQILEP
jgi:hypothetical protein